MARRDDGFTLVELMVVVLVIAALVAIAIPVFYSAKARAASATCLANRTIIERAAPEYRTTEGTAPATLQDFVLKKLVKTLPRCPSKGIYVWKSGGDSPGKDELYCSVHYSGAASPLWSSNWGNAALLNVLRGAWTNVNGLFTPTVPNGLTALFKSPTPNDFRLESTAILNAGPGYGIYFRSTAVGGNISGYCFQFDPGLGNKFVVRKVTNGAESGPIAISAMPAGFPIYGASHKTTITAIGSHIVVKVDGVPVLDFVDSTYSSGQTGMRAWYGSNVGFKDISVYGATP
jgi:prepilin-type N-terminal cleavage/methylation domain-containing protein